MVVGLVINIRKWCDNMRDLNAKIKYNSGSRIYYITADNGDGTYAVKRDPNSADGGYDSVRPNDGDSYAVGDSVNLSFDSGDRQSPSIDSHSAYS